MDAALKSKVNKQNEWFRTTTVVSTGETTWEWGNSPGLVHHFRKRKRHTSWQHHHESPVATASSMEVWMYPGHPTFSGTSKMFQVRPGRRGFCGQWNARGCESLPVEVLIANELFFSQWIWKFIHNTAQWKSNFPLTPATKHIVMTQHLIAILAMPKQKRGE